MPDLPIACTLSPDGLTERLALIDVLAADGMLARSATHGGIRVRLRDDPEIERRARQLAAAESRCCAFLDFAVWREEGAVWLEVSGPPDARPVIDMFFAAEAA